MSSNKRPLEDAASTPSKRPKSDASPADTAASISSAELIARKRAEVAAKLANFSALAQKPAASATRQSLQPPSSASLPPRPVNTNAVNVPATPSAPTTASKLPPGIDPDLARKIAEAKRRATASRANIEISNNPYLAAAVAAGPRKSGSSTPAPVAPQSAGLKMAAHPLLLDNAPTAAAPSKKDRYKPMQPKFASIKANVRNAPAPAPPPAPTVKQEGSSSNPYTSSGAPAPGVDTVTVGAPRDRPSRNFRFIQKGKYVQLGDQLRQDAQLEDLKKRIAETAKKAGLDSEFETLEKTIRREAPPDVEWWDEALLPSKTYDDIQYDENSRPILVNTNIRTAESPITFYVQHPIPIPSPWDKHQIELKPLKLTKREQKKIRKQRRMAEMQDKQDRQKMGLIPPDAPKVRLANLMRVLTSDAVQDPTKVEARVRREVALRKKTHEVMNAERKLTDDQRREKLETKKVEEEKKGIFAAVYKIKTLSDPSHRFKVRKNAEQYGLTGVCIFNPNFSLVVVEGSTKAIKQFNRLMLVRMQWTEAARAKDATAGDDDEPDAEGAPATIKKEDNALADPTAKSLEDNTCDKVWEGPLRDRVFPSFKAKSCPTDKMARDMLSEKMANYWDVAKSFVREEDL